MPAAGPGRAKRNGVLWKFGASRVRTMRRGGHLSTILGRTVERRGPGTEPRMVTGLRALDARFARAGKLLCSCRTCSRADSLVKGRQTDEAIDWSWPIPGVDAFGGHLRRDELPRVVGLRSHPPMSLVTAEFVQ